MKFLKGFFLLFFSFNLFAASTITAPLIINFSDLRDSLVLVGGSVIGLAVVALAVRWVKATFF